MVRIASHLPVASRVAGVTIQPASLMLSWGTGLGLHLFQITLCADVRIGIRVRYVFPMISQIPSRTELDNKCAGVFFTGSRRNARIRETPFTMTPFVHSRTIGSVRPWATKNEIPWRTHKPGQ